MTFSEVLNYCANRTDFVTEWSRLRGVSLPTTPIERMVDEATGRNDSIAKQFIEDVYDIVWSRLDPAVRTVSGMDACRANG